MKPLNHVTILDLSRVLACPFASMILAELGATVIKIEEPNRGDETRSFEPFVQRNGASESAYYFACNRGKQSVTVNLRSPEGQSIIRDLAHTADVFLENFPVGTKPPQGGGSYAPPSPGQPGDGPDPVVGEGTQGKAIQLHQSSGTHPIALTADLVRMTGGEYFFCPAIDALRALGQ